MAVFPWGVACGGDVALVRGLFVPARGDRAEVALDHLGVEDGVGHLNDPRLEPGAGVRKGSLVPGHDAVVVELGDEAVEGVAHDAEGVGDDARGELGRAVHAAALGIPGLSGVRLIGKEILARVRQHVAVGRAHPETDAAVRRRELDGGAARLGDVDEHGFGLRRSGG